MRINVYAEELTEDAMIVDEMVCGRRFVGVRIWLKSPPELLDGNNDDRSAVTFWFKDRYEADRMLTAWQHALKQS